MKESEEMIKTSVVVILGVLFYMCVMSHDGWREELINERVISHPDLRKKSRIW